MAEITLYNQDCIAAMKQIDAESIDLIVTDPPYNLGNFMKKRDTNLKKMRDNFFGSAGWDDMEFDEWSKSMDETTPVVPLPIKGSSTVSLGFDKISTKC